MTPRARMLEALSPAARAMVGEHLDPADAWLAEHDGLTAAQAKSRARNSRRLGRKWPDAAASLVLLDIEDCENLIQPNGFFGICPLQILEAIEAAAAALDANDAAKKLEEVGLVETCTIRAGRALGITNRRAQQIKKLALESGDPARVWAEQIQAVAARKIKAVRAKKSASARKKIDESAQIPLFKKPGRRSKK
jgi:hypothetical protein